MVYPPPVFIPGFDISGYTTPAIDFATIAANEARATAASAMTSGFVLTQDNIDFAKVYAATMIANEEARAAAAAVRAYNEWQDAYSSNVDGTFAALTDITASQTETILDGIGGAIGGLADFITEPLKWLAGELGEFVGAFAAGFWGELEERL